MWTSFFIDLTPEEAVRLFAREGWRTLELSTEHAAALLKRGGPSAQGEKFRRLCEDLGVSLPQGHLKLSADIAHIDPHARQAEVDELRGWLDLFAAIGVRAAVLHPGGGCLRSGPLPPETFRLSVESLSELAPYAAARGITICLENGKNAAELLSLIEAVGSEGLGICFDTGHLAVLRARGEQDAQNELDFIRQAGRHLKALHLADNDGSADQHRLPYRGGAVGWPAVMDGLRQVGYQGTLNFEVPGECIWPPLGLEERLERLRRAAHVAEALLTTGMPPA